MIAQPGDFGLTHIDGMVGLLIRVGQWLNGDGFTDHEHAFLVMPCGMILEGAPGGARLILNPYPDSETSYSSWTLTDAQRSKIIAGGQQVVGIPYSFLDYLSLALEHFGVRPRWLTRYVASNKHMICSQLVDYVYGQAGLMMFADGRLAGDVTPADLMNVLQGPLTKGG